jgi:dTMP kinase
MNRGMFITLEGIEGAGKSTAMAFIKQRFESAGKKVIITREPGGTDLGEQIRVLLLDAQSIPMSAESELLLMFAARAEHLEKLIKPALASGHIILCDRFTDATYAYQGGGRGVSAGRIAQLESWVQGELRPDLTLLFDVSTKIGRDRAGQRGRPDRFEQEDGAFFERVRKTYLNAAQREPRRIRVINADQSREQVERQLTQIIDEVLHEHA